MVRGQLENSEKMRIETQTTVETIRGEFDLLVKVGCCITMVGTDHLAEEGRR
jgi:hypothetical protein